MVLSYGTVIGRCHGHAVTFFIACDGSRYNERRTNVLTPTAPPWEPMAVPWKTMTVLCHAIERQTMYIPCSYIMHTSIPLNSDIALLRRTTEKYQSVRLFLGF